MNGSPKARFFASRSLPTTIIGGIVAMALILSFVAYGNVATARRTSLSADADRAQSAQALYNTLYLNEARLARNLATTYGSQYTSADYASSFRGNASRLQSNQNEINGAYFVDPSGRLLAGMEMDAGAFGPVAVLPSALRGSGDTALQRALRATLKRDVEGQALSFADNAGDYGNLYLFEPVQSIRGDTLGAVILRADNAAVAGHFLSQSGTMLVIPPFVLDASTPNRLTQNKVGVLSGLPASTLHDSSLFGATSPAAYTSLTARNIGKGDTLQLSGAPQLNGAATLDGFSTFHVISYSPQPTFLSTLGTTFAGGAGIILVILLGVGAVLFLVYQESRVRAATAAAQERRSAALTDDILNVSQALSAARDGDLTVEVPSAESEVGLISVMINGLLTDYSHMVAGIMRASEAVQDGALRIDEGVRSIVDSAARQGEEIAVTAATVGDLSASAVEVHEATRTATGLAADASRSVQQGQEAVARIGDAVDSIKEAAIGTTREFKHLQEDSIRLTALVSSVKSNAENLDMQAANATLEARHLGTETGSAFATNIGRLARQAQETLAEAETAVRSVVTSIDAVNRRIERISEQVRLGVDEVRSIRGTFDGITETNEALVEFIERVAGSAQTQAESAQSVAASISAITTTFQQFNDLLTASSDEMASMRLVVADLQESVANLTVDDAVLHEGASGAAERAA